MASLTIQSETTRVNFVEYLGDTILMKFAYKDSDGVLIDLLNTRIVMELRKDQTDVIPLLVYSSTNGEIDLTGTEANIIIVIPSSFTSTLAPGDYFYFITTQTDTSEIQDFVNTLITGKLVLKVR